MTWSWTTGYILVKLEGKYGISSANTEFMNHTGNMGNVTANNTPNLYREVTLELPTTARVSVHILADFNHYLSGESALGLSTANDIEIGSNQHLVNVTNN